MWHKHYSKQTDNPQRLLLFVILTLFSSKIKLLEQFDFTQNFTVTVKWTNTYSEQTFLWISEA